MSNGGQSKLEIAAIDARNKLIPRNTYNNADKANEYSATHTRALSDKSTPLYGKGSGVFLDITNYKGVGGDWDINGNPAIAVGSGRNAAMAYNNSLWGYGPEQLGLQRYKIPDMSKNKGQVVIPA